MRVLIAEDNHEVAGALSELVGAAQHEVVEIAASGLRAMSAYERLRPDVVMMDYMMSGLNGATACRNIMAKHPAARVVLVSAALQPHDLSRMDCGARAILRKPVDLLEVQRVLAEVAA